MRGAAADPVYSRAPAAHHPVMIGLDNPVFLAAPLLVPPVPQPPEGELPLLRFITTVGTNGIGIWPRAAYETPVQHRTLLGRARLKVSDPEAVRQVLVDNAENYSRTAISILMLRPVLGDGLLISEGAAWRHQRRTLAPAFTPRAVEMLAPHICTATDVATRELESAGREVDLFGALQRLALEIAGRTMFSVGMAEHGAGLRALVEDYQTRLGRPRLLDFLLPLGWPSPYDVARARFRRCWTAHLDRIVADRGSGSTGAARDLLNLLGAARDPETGRAFSPEDLRDQVATLILAGHENTALTPLWACTLLAQAPGIQEALAAEARADPGTGDPTRRLPPTRAVVDETLRMYPPAYFMARGVRSANQLAGHAVAAGTDRDQRALPSAPPPHAMAKTRRVRPVALPVRRAGDPAFRLPALRRGPAGLHRRAVIAVGGRIGAGMTRRTVPHRARRRPAGPARGSRDPAARPRPGLSLTPRNA